MAKQEWLYCGYDWKDVSDIIKLTKNPNKRLQEFNDILRKDEMTVNDILKRWHVLDKKEIESYTEEWFFSESEMNSSITYWFFNIYTGEALHIIYFMHRTGIIKD